MAVVTVMVDSLDAQSAVNRSLYRDVRQGHAHAQNVNSALDQRETGSGTLDRQEMRIPFAESWVPASWMLDEHVAEESFGSESNRASGG